MTFEEWFLEFSTWGLTHKQLISCAYTPGEDSGDIVYTSPTGSVMTRYMCSHWLSFYSAAQAGWNARERLIQIILDRHPRNGGYSFVTSNDLPGFSYMMQPGEGDENLKEAVVTFIEADIRLPSAGLRAAETAWVYDPDLDDGKGGYEWWDKCLVKAPQPTSKG